MLPLKTTIEHAREEGEEDDAVGEHETVTTVDQLAWQVAVAGDDRRQAGEVGVGGVGGEDQDGERAELRHPEQDALAAVDVLGHEGDPGRVVLAAVGLQVGGEDRHAEEAGAEDGAHDGDRRRRVAALGLAERRDAVGHRLDAGEGDGTRREGPQQEQHAEGLGALGELLRLRREVFEGDGADVLDEDAVEADADQQHQHADVQVGRWGEHRPRFLEAAQVGDRHHGDQGQAQRDPPAAVEPERRLDRQHAAGDRHGDGEDVVGEQGGAGDQRRRPAEVLAGHDVGPAAGRVGVDRLAVRRHDDHQEHRDDDRQRHQLVPRRGADAGLDEQHDEDLVGGVRRRRDGVGREHRQGDPLGEPLVALVGGRDRLADQDPLGQRSHRSQRIRNLGRGRDDLVHGSFLRRQPHRRERPSRLLNAWSQNLRGTFARARGAALVARHASAIGHGARTAPRRPIDVALPATRSSGSVRGSPSDHAHRRKRVHVQRAA